MGDASLPSAALARTDPTPIQVLIEQGQARLGARDVDIKDLKPFYAPRGYLAAWADAHGGYDLERFTNDIRSVADEHGLNTHDYELATGLNGPQTDLCISDALARLGRDLATGRIAPYRILGGMGQNVRPRFDPAAFLRQVQSGTPLHDLAARTAPTDAGYLGLQQALKTYRGYSAAGGWQAIPAGPTIKPGDSEPRVVLLRKRLAATADLAADKVNDSPILDADVAEALKHFQLRHGLDPDGSVGKRTLYSLNVPAANRVRQIELAMERARQTPRVLAATRVEVNIAAQELTLFQNNAPELSMRVVVGDVKHQTPAMMTRVATLTVNPSWTVPASIAKKEILPKLKRDPNYLANNNIRLIDPRANAQPAPQSTPQPGSPAPGGAGSGAGTGEPVNEDVDGTAIDWKQMGSSFPFVLRQRPGPDNALGQLKFNLQDQDAIYMHDTPQKTFFKRSYRALSHGCIRLEKPMDLADRLLSPHWQGKLTELLADTKTATVGLTHSIPVYIYYRTAWTDAEGSIAFREDIYGNDYRLDDALRHGIPLSALQLENRNL